MVLVQSAPQSLSLRPATIFSGTAFSRLVSQIHPNPARVFGIAGALALPAALLMLLATPQPISFPDMSYQGPEVIWVLPEQKKPPIPVPVVDPKPIQQPPTPAPVQTRTTPQPVDIPVLVDNGIAADPLPADPLPGPTVVDPAPAPTGPVAGVRLEYASAPAPGYPRRALLDRTEGQVLLQVLVDIDGKPLKVDIHRSSGNRELDRAAQQQVLKLWTFRPATQDGHPIQAIGLVPIDFKLQ